MSRTTGFFAAFGLLVVLAVRAFAPATGEEPLEGFYAPARQVDADAPATTWAPSREVRDPFVPLVLPTPTVAAAEDLEEE